MKTNIKTLAAICILGFIGLININAIADNKKAPNTEMNNLKEEMLKMETTSNEDAFFKLAEEITAMGVDAQIDKFATRQILLERKAVEHSDFEAAAESITALGVDKEIARYAEKIIKLENAKNEK